MPAYWQVVALPQVRFSCGTASVGTLSGRRSAIVAVSASEHGPGNRGASHGRGLRLRQEVNDRRIGRIRLLKITIITAARDLLITTSGNVFRHLTADIAWRYQIVPEPYYEAL
jgi:hypothetical protein